MPETTTPPVGAVTVTCSPVTGAGMPPIMVAPFPDPSSGIEPMTVPSRLTLTMAFWGPFSTDTVVVEGSWPSKRNLAWPLAELPTRGARLWTALAAAWPPSPMRAAPVTSAIRMPVGRCLCI